MIRRGHPQTAEPRGRDSARSAGRLASSPQGARRVGREAAASQPGDPGAVSRFDPALAATSVQRISMVSLRPERMRDHWWWRPGWRAGRRLYTSHLTYEVSRQQLRQLVVAAERRCGALAPLTLTLGPARVDPEGVCLPVAPQGPVRWLRMAVRGAIAEVLGEGRVPDAAEEFWPHVSVAYSNADGPAAPIVERVGRVGALEAVVTIGEVRLLELERAGHVYRWETRAVVPLGTVTS